MTDLEHRTTGNLIRSGAVLDDLIANGVTLPELAAHTAGELILSLARGELSEAAPPKDLAAILKALHPYTVQHGRSQGRATVPLKQLIETLLEREKVDTPP